MKKRYRETRKEMLRNGCLLLGWKKWIAAGIIIYILLHIVQLTVQIDSPKETANLFDELFRMIRKYIEGGAEYGKYAAIIFCFMRAACEALKKD